MAVDSIGNNSIIISITLNCIKLKALIKSSKDLGVLREEGSMAARPSIQVILKVALELFC